MQSESHSYFLNQGPFFNFTEPEDSQTPFQNEFIITVDEVQQNLLYNSITFNDCNFFIFVDIACNGVLFMLEKVLNVDTKLLTLQIYVSDTNDINGTCSAVPDLTKQIPKLFCISKKVELTQKNILKKR